MLSKVDPKWLIAALWPSRGDGKLAQIYAVLDGARDERICTAVANSSLESCCLYRGALHPDLEKAAPYLVRLDPDDPFTTWLLVHGWGASWGIFAECALPMHLVRRHFRTFLMVYTEDRRPLYFRYYDPRVLRIFLPTCKTDELKVIFGPLSEYVVESEDSAQLLRFAFAGGKLIQSPASTRSN